MKKEIKVFFRQSLTESNEEQQQLIQKILDKVAHYETEDTEVSILTGTKAHNKGTFKKSFTNEFGLEFTPANFRRERLRMLSEADLFIIARTAMSESSAFEIAYNIFKGKNIPMLFLVSDQAKIKTTLIRELEDIADATYFTFGPDNEDMLEDVIQKFILKKGVTTQTHY